MRLYLVRHAIAVPRDAPGVLDDRLRELTPAGMAKTRRIVRALARLRLAVDEIWSSPLVRARQTADLLAEGFPRAASVRVVRALEPGGDFDELLRAMARHAQLDGVALVGHEPDLGELVGTLLVGRRQGVVEFKKGGVACVEVDSFVPPCRGTLLWMLTPRQARLMS